MPSTKPWSFSGMDAFESCPRRFYGQYETKKFPYVETEAMREGKRVDQAFTLRLDQRSRVKLPTKLEQYEPWCQAFEKAGAVHTQMDLSVRQDFGPAEFFGKDVWCRAQADITVLGRNAANIYDVKNGNPNFEKPLQLKIYTVGLFARFPDVMVVKTANIYMKTTGLGTVNTFTREHDLPLIRADMVKRNEAIEEARRQDRWPAIPSGLCRGFCPDKDCQHWSPPRT